MAMRWYCSKSSIVSLEKYLDILKVKDKFNNLNKSLLYDEDELIVNYSLYHSFFIDSFRVRIFFTFDEYRMYIEG